MNYTIGEIRNNILNLKSNDDKGFFISVPEGVEIMFHRVEDDILIRNHQNPDKPYLHFERNLLLIGDSEEERNFLFARFLEDIREEYLHIII